MKPRLMSSTSLEKTNPLGKEVAVGSIPTGSIRNPLKSYDNMVRRLFAETWRSARKSTELRRMAQDNVTKSVPCRAKGSDLLFLGHETTRAGNWHIFWQPPVVDRLRRNEEN